LAEFIQWITQKVLINLNKFLRVNGLLWLCFQVAEHLQWNFL